MNREDLKVGALYKSNLDADVRQDVVVKLVGFAYNDDPILLPILGCGWAVTYEKDIGGQPTTVFSHTMADFLMCYIPNTRLREVRVTFSDDNVVETNVAAHLTDDEIKDYYRVGKTFSSNHSDEVVEVTKCEILF